MEKIDISLNVQELRAIMKDSLSASIQKGLAANKEQIEQSVNTFLRKSFFDNKSTAFESALDWAIEQVFRDGLQQAMDELNYKELVAQKAKEILSNNDFIKDLAERKVRASLGLPSNITVA
jgi:hypothetical protein